MDLLTAPREAIASAFGLGSSLRGERVLHPDGAAFTGVLEVAGGTTWGSGVLDEPASRTVTVRVSRSIGLPRWLPDVGGVAVRIPGAGAGGDPLDLLFATTGSAPGLRHVLLPAARGRRCTTLLPYRTGSGKHVLLAASPDGPGIWRLEVAELLGGWQPWAVLALGAALLPSVSEALRFMPTTGAADLRHTDLLRRLRERSYVKSQAHRPSA